MINGKTYVQTDESGTMRVGGTRISLDSVVYPFREGQSPECIRQAYPGLSLEQVYGAITYYLANQDEVDEYLVRQEALWDELRERCERNRPPFVERMLALTDEEVQELKDERIRKFKERQSGVQQ